jgi:hypothetical protein
MFNNAVLGLKLLKNSYSTYATIQHTIDYYIIILMQRNTAVLTKMGINNIDIDRLTNAIFESGSNTLSSENNQESKNKSNNESIENVENMEKTQLKDIHKFLYELWNTREINIVINLYREMENKSAGVERNYIYNNIMQYCEMKENKLYKYIEQNSSVL